MGQGVLTQPFPRVDGRVVCGEVPLEDLADTFGTPLYVYDLAWIRRRVAAFREAFQGADPLLAYSVKANGNLSLLRELESLGCGADITSGGELFRARSAGIDPSDIVFAGVGKSEEEIAYALDEGIYAFNVESRSELARIERVAAGKGMRARFGIRVNPDVAAATPHEFTATGHSETKFGVPWEETRALYRWALERDSLDPIGIDVHIGSQIVDTGPYVRALDRVLGVVTELRQEGIPLEYLDIGGGFGISYGHGPALDLCRLAAEVVPRVMDAGLRLVLEPGRSLVGEAGVFLTRVQYVKDGGPKTFVIVDGGMSELIRPSHYGGYHAIEPAGAIGERGNVTVDVVGPICETGDFLALNRPLPEPREGELLAVRTSGAYGFSMASNYNGRLRPAEVLVDGSDVRVGRRRETYQDLIRGEA
ncbi:MAG: diaminopimelate decarboxylase [Gemmatimonadota bacterium]|nr:diaminopimelate decarboxylase [Gemmatimonadota bacterium]MDE3005911.1 diaminopimelate decarboxylase [Gemmatimonadota bacterium]